MKRKAENVIPSFSSIHWAPPPGVRCRVRDAVGSHTDPGPALMGLMTPKGSCVLNKYRPK